jgi:hypothetical protein
VSFDDRLQFVETTVRRLEKQARDLQEYIKVLEDRIEKDNGKWYMPARLAAAACGMSMGRLAKARRAGLLPEGSYRVKNKRRIEYLESAMLSRHLWDSPSVS